MLPVAAINKLTNHAPAGLLCSSCTGRMLMAAATHMGGSAHSSSSSSISPPQPPWHPVVLVPNHQHHQALYDLDLVVTPSPSPTTPTTPQRCLRPAARRAGKPRRPRPSRKLPTTYISTDAASFRRMVHQVTGADDLVVHQQATAELLCRPAASSSRAALTTTAATLVPTLDTSAFLLGAAGGAGAPPAPSFCHGSAVAVRDPGAALQAEEACRSRGVGRGGGGEYSCSNGGGGGVGFPSLESWDDDALF